MATFADPAKHEAVSLATEVLEILPIDAKNRTGKRIKYRKPACSMSMHVTLVARYRPAGDKLQESRSMSHTEPWCPVTTTADVAWLKWVDRTLRLQCDPSKSFHGTWCGAQTFFVSKGDSVRFMMQ
ncbi:hypothetical protein J1614_009763 [Plenodomus biglobosus]|nr:hypothetical protein J1614_009763 [Plenodomus biglobosus]